MIQHPVWRALIALAVTLVAIALLGRVLLSVHWLTTPGWLVAWALSIALGVAVFVGLGRSFVKVHADDPSGH
jgi:hypothetical protein